MARTIAEIKRVITDNFTANETIIARYSLDRSKTFEEQFSVVSIESILFYIVAYSIWVLERLFDTHRADVLALIDTLKPHSLKWYSEKAKAFQYGFDLLPDSDQFNNEGRTDQEIEASKIVKYAAVIEQENFIQMKVAKVESNDLAALAPEELSVFGTYINRVKDAGVVIELLTDEAERLKLSLRIFYNPLVLSSSGSRIDGGNDTPVVTAIKNYLANISFDGTFVKQDLVDALQQVEGIVIISVDLCQYRYGDIGWTDIDVYRRPLSGYIRISDDDLLITYTARSTV